MLKNGYLATYLLSEGSSDTENRNSDDVNPALKHMNTFKLLF